MCAVFADIYLSWLYAILELKLWFAQDLKVGEMLIVFS